MCVARSNSETPTEAVPVAPYTSRKVRPGSVAKLKQETRRCKSGTIQYSCLQDTTTMHASTITRHITCAKPAPVKQTSQCTAHPVRACRSQECQAGTEMHAQVKSDGLALARMRMELGKQSSPGWLGQQSSCWRRPQEARTTWGGLDSCGQDTYNMTAAKPPQSGQFCVRMESYPSRSNCNYCVDNCGTQYT
jgi:hypothetical protein